MSKRGIQRKKIKWNSNSFKNWVCCVFEATVEKRFDMGKPNIARKINRPVLKRSGNSTSRKNRNKKTKKLKALPVEEYQKFAKLACWNTNVKNIQPSLLRNKMDVVDGLGLPHCPSVCLSFGPSVHPSIKVIFLLYSAPTQSISLHSSLSYILVSTSKNQIYSCHSTRICACMHLLIWEGRVKDRKVGVGWSSVCTL